MSAPLLPPSTLRPFALERYFARYEFDAPYLLSPSDCEPLTLAGLLARATPAQRARWETLSLGYTHSAGAPELREAIVALDERLPSAPRTPPLSAPHSAEELIVLAPEEGIYLAMEALLSPGDEVIVTWPGYQSLYEIARAKGCALKRWVAEEAPGRGWCFKFEQLEALLSDKTKLLVVNTPHNPTGAHFTVEEQAQLAALAERRGFRIFSDEIYRGLERPGVDRLPVMSTLSDRVISLGGLSKAFNLPGLRIGWVSTRDRALLGRIQDLRDYTTICSSAPSEALALIALSLGASLFRENCARIERHIEALDALCVRMSERLSWSPPRAGSVGLLKWGGEAPASEVAERLVSEAGVMVLPSTIFEFGDRHLRVGLGRENFLEALERFAAHLGAL